MLRMSKLADYSTVVLSSLAREPARTRTAAELAAESATPLPTVSKILKTLARNGLLTSVRGASGGYLLAKPPAQVSVADIIFAMEGPISLTECNHHPGVCVQETTCTVRHHWSHINDAVRDALARVSLADLAQPQRKAGGVAPIRWMKNARAEKKALALATTR
jgi:FeS assembly SUF system regulator